MQAALRAAKVPTFIFSNTNDLAIEHIRRNFPFFEQFDGYIFSYEIGGMKPQVEAVIGTAFTTATSATLNVQFQAAVDTGRPVQPLRLRYQHRDGRVSTVPAYIGDDTLLRSIGRLLVARRTVARIYAESLQLPGEDRRDLARRCQAAIRLTAVPHPGHGQRPSVLAS